MATSINAIGGVTYPGPIIPASDTTYPINGTDPTDFANDAITNPLDGGNPATSLSPYDLDGNGTVTPQEYQQALSETSTALPTTTFASLTASRDSDGDGIPDASDTNDYVPDQTGFAAQQNAALNNPNGFDTINDVFQNPVVSNLAAQTYGAVATADIEQPLQQQQQQQLSLFA